MRFKAGVAVMLVAALIPSCSYRKPALDSQRTTVVEMHLAAREPRSGFSPMIFAETGESIYVSPEVILSNRDISRAQLVLDDGGRPAVEILLNPVGTKKFARFTSEHLGEMTAILVEGNLTSAPVIRAQIAHGQVIIHGEFTEEEANDLAQSIVLDE